MNQIPETFFDPPLQETEAPISFLLGQNKTQGSDLLEVTQVFGHDIMAQKLFSPSKEMCIYIYMCLCRCFFYYYVHGATPTRRRRGIPF